MVAGLICWWVDLHQVFSAALPTVRYLREHQLSDDLITVSHDAWGISISGYLGKDVYGLNAGRMQKQLTYNTEWVTSQNASAQEVFEKATALLSAQTNHLVIITSYPLRVQRGNSSEDLVEEKFWPNRRIVRLAEFTNSMTDEIYWVYRLEEIPGALFLPP
jgi:hypothetical protein